MFDLTIVDDTEIDGTQTATVTAHVENWTDGTAHINVLDNDRFMIVSIPSDAWEGETVTGEVFIGGTLTSDLIVSLASNDTSKLTVPGTVTILAGHTWANFNLTLLTDGAHDGTQTARITASASGFSNSVDLIFIHDSDLDHFVWDPISSPQVAHLAFPVTVKAENSIGETIAVYVGSANLSASDSAGPVPFSPTTCTFAGGIWTGSAVVDAVAYGVVLTVDDGAGHTANSNPFDVPHGPLDHFQWSTIASPQHHGVPFTVTLTAMDADGNTVTDYNGSLNLSGFKSGTLSGEGIETLTPVSVSPTTLVLAGGIWSGQVTVLEPADNMYLSVNDGLGHAGASNPFDVVPVPGEIHGSKWNDLDNDGQWDAGEPGLPGWTIFLDTDKDGVLDPGEISTVTGADGSYAFTNLSPGSYTVAEVTKTGWTQTYPVTLSGQSRLFELRVSGTTGTISEVDRTTGSVIRSFVAPGTISSIGWQGLALGSNSLFYINGYSTVAHTLYELNPDTGAIIDSDVVDASSPQPIDGLGYLNGKVYIQRCASTQILVWDPVTDVALTPLTVAPTLYGGMTGAADLNVLFATDSPGNIYKLNPTTGAVITTFKPGYGLLAGVAYTNDQLIVSPYGTTGIAYRINPDTGAVLGSFTLGGTGTLTALGGDGAGGNGVYTVVLASGQLITGRDFGNHQLVTAEIHGSKWNDLNGNGKWDTGEPALSGVTVYLDANNNGVLDAGEISTTTAADGSYAFTGLAPGTYTVAEVVPAGWQQTYPTAYNYGRLFALRENGTTATIYELNPSTGAVIHSFTAPGTITTASGFQGLALGPNSLFYIDGYGSTPHTLWELNPNTGTVIDSDIIDAASPSSFVSGLGYLNGKVYIDKPDRRQIFVWDPVADTLVTTFSVSADITGGLTGAANLNAFTAPMPPAKY